MRKALRLKVSTENQARLSLALSAQAPLPLTVWMGLVRCGKLPGLRKRHPGPEECALSLEARGKL